MPYIRSCTQDSDGKGATQLSEHICKVKNAMGKARCDLSEDVLSQLFCKLEFNGDRPDIKSARDVLGRELRKRYFDNLSCSNYG